MGREVESCETGVQDLGCEIGVLVDAVVDLGKGFEVGEGGLGEECPVGGGEGVEVLTAGVGCVVVGCFAVLAGDVRW